MPAADVPVEIRGAGPGDAPGDELPARRARSTGRPPDLRRGADTRRQLVVLPAAQARRHARLARRTTRRSTTSGSGAPDRSRRATRASPCIERTRPTARSTRPSSSATATCSSSRAATTARASPPPAIPLYYLNVMAGPNPERTMAIVDDPAYALDPRDLGRDAHRSALPDDDRGRVSREADGSGSGVVGFGWMGQAHSRSYRRIPTLFPDRAGEPDLVVCSDTVRGAPRRGRRRRSASARATDDWRGVCRAPRRRRRRRHGAEHAPRRRRRGRVRRPASTSSARSPSAARPSRPRGPRPPPAPPA